MNKKYKNKNINSKKVIGLTSALLAGSLLTSCHLSSAKKEYEYRRLIRTSDGDYSQSDQYEPFDSDDNKYLSNKFISYSAWEQKDDKYYRSVDEYDVLNKTYEDIKILFDNKDISIDDVLGEPIKSYKQVSDNLSEEEINRGAYFETTLYSKNETKYVTIVESSDAPVIALGFGIGAFNLGLVGLSAYKTFIDNQNKKEDAKKLTLKREK